MDPTTPRPALLRRSRVATIPSLLFVLAVPGGQFPLPPAGQDQPVPTREAPAQERSSQEKPAQEPKAQEPAQDEATTRPATGQEQKGQDPTSPPTQGGGQDPAAGQAVDIDEILKPFDEEGLLGRLASAPLLVRVDEDSLSNNLLPLLTGDRKQLVLEVRNLVDGLSDPRFQVREESEKQLVNLGPRIKSILDEIDPNDLEFEAKLRLGYAKKEIAKLGDEDIQRRARLARGLAECLEYRRGPVECRALMLALDHIDLRVRLAAIRSLGEQLRDPALAAEHGEAFRKRIGSELDELDLERRNAAMTALGRMPVKASEVLCDETLKDASKALSLRFLALRILAERLTPAELEQRAAGLQGEGADQLLTALRWLVADAKARAAAEGGEGAAAPTPTAVEVLLRDQGKLRTSLLGAGGDKLELLAPPEFGSLQQLRLPRAQIDRIKIPGAEPRPGTGTLLVLLKSGTRLLVSDPVYDGKELRGRTLDRDVVLGRDLLSALMPAGAKPRAYGGSRRNDQLRLADQDGKPVEGRLVKADGTGLVFAVAGKEVRHEYAGLGSVMFQVETRRAEDVRLGDMNQYLQADLRDGQRVIGFLLALDENRLVLSSGPLGSLVLPLGDLETIGMANSGQALTGFRLIVDYINNRVLEIDGEGREVWDLPDLFTPMDAELLVDGNVLVAENTDPAVREYDRDKKVVWEYTKLSGPRAAQRLPNGNTLITDPGMQAVLEVSREKKVVWEYGVEQAKRKDFKPFDAERLSNGNTLITDHEGDKIIEVTPDCKVVWEFAGRFQDADRLPNGNTLACRSVGASTFEAIEISPSKQIVWRIPLKDFPTDVDRLPDGTTIVAEESGARIYNREGQVISRVYPDWTLEVNSY
ncbi:MAG: hypothetical protein R3F30_10095 [Planctomycetota bacterium]